MPFTTWTHTATLAGKLTPHVWVWNRHATFTITEQRSDVGAAPFVWTVTPSGESQAIYITRDGVQTGPLTRALWFSRFHLVQDLTKLGQNL